MPKPPPKPKPIRVTFLCPAYLYGRLVQTSQDDRKTLTETVVARLSNTYPPEPGT